MPYDTDKVVVIRGVRELLKMLKTKNILTNANINKIKKDSGFS